MEGPAQPLAQLTVGSVTISCLYRQGQAVLALNDGRTYPFSLIRSISLRRGNIFTHPRLTVVLKTGETVVDLHLSRRKSAAAAALAFMQTCNGCLKSAKNN